MSKIKQKICTLWILFFSISCGTIIGNGYSDPTTSDVNFSPINIPPISQADIIEVISEYNQSNASEDCGNFTQNNTAEEIEAGRDCIRQSFNGGTDCVTARYLLNKVNPDNSKFVSFVEVVDEGQCKLRIHTVSNVQPENIGNVLVTCSELGEEEIPEVSCGILDE